MKLLLISNSTNYKEPYLGWCMDLIVDFLKNENKIHTPTQIGFFVIC